MYLVLSVDKMWANSFFHSHSLLVICNYSPNIIKDNPNFCNVIGCVSQKHLAQQGDNNNSIWLKKVFL